MVIQTIQELENSIRKCINNPRKQYILLQNHATWNQLCSSLDIIGDTDYALSSYIKDSGPSDIGMNYIYIYGFLQALILQQDAIRYCANALGIVDELGRKYKGNPTLEMVRQIRNRSSGHPMNCDRDAEGGSYNFISQISMSKWGFTLHSSRPEKRTTVEEIDLQRLLKEQTEITTEALIIILDKLTEEDMKHKKAFEGENLIDNIPPTLGYYFEKMYAATYETNPGQKTSAMHLGKVHFDSVMAVVEKIKIELTKRGLYPAYSSLKNIFDEISYPLAELEKYFSSNSGAVNDKTANIFIFFIQQQINEELMVMLKELDEKYKVQGE